MIKCMLFYTFLRSNLSVLSQLGPDTDSPQWLSCHGLCIFLCIHGFSVAIHRKRHIRKWVFIDISDEVM